VLEGPIRACEQNPGLGAGIALESPFAFSVSFQGFAWAWLGRLDRAAESLERGMRLAQEHGDTETAAWNHMWSVFTASYVGDVDRAVAHARQGAEIAERIGDSFSRSWARATLGLAQLMRGEWRDAADALEAALSLARERRVALEGEPWWLAALANVRASMGERVMAAQLVDETLESLARTESLLSETVGRRMVAEAMLELDGAGAADAARSQLDHALGLAGNSGHRAEQALAMLAMARLERLSGNRGAAIQRTEAAHRTLVEIGAEPRAEQVRRELGANLVE
jgi:tetratricopeptide (TPR) repeat protein